MIKTPSPWSRIPIMSHTGILDYIYISLNERSRGMIQSFIPCVYQPHRQFTMKLLVQDHLWQFPLDIRLKGGNVSTDYWQYIKAYRIHKMWEYYITGLNACWFSPFSNTKEIKVAKQKPLPLTVWWDLICVQSGREKHHKGLYEWLVRNPTSSNIYRPQMYIPVLWRRVRWHG